MLSLLGVPLGTTGIRLVATGVALAFEGEVTRSARFGAADFAVTVRPLAFKVPRVARAGAASSIAALALALTSRSCASASAANARASRDDTRPVERVPRAGRRERLSASSSSKATSSSVFAVDGGWTGGGGRCVVGVAGRDGV